MKRILSILLALVLVLGLCGSFASAAEDDTSAEAAVTEEAAAPAVDGDDYETESDWQHATFISGANGWQQIDGVWYYYQAGFRMTDWWKVGGVWYYLDADAKGAMLIGWQLIDGVQYYFKSSGAMATGWQKIYNEDLGEYKWYYFNAGGSQATGWKQVNGTWYYMNKGSIPTENYMLTGWQQIDGTWYYFKDSGAMATGWTQITPTWTNKALWYYFKSSGALATGWQKINGTWYYLSSIQDNSPVTCYMISNWTVASGSSRYLMGSSGAMVTTPGWHKVTHEYGTVSWFYTLDNSGKLAVGWKKINGTWYYFDEDAEMVQNACININGTAYAFDSNGAWIQKTGWIKSVTSITVYGTTLSHTEWSYSENGSTLTTGWKKIDGAWYYFNEDGSMAYNANISPADNGYLYVMGSSGAWVTSTGWVKMDFGDGDIEYTYSWGGYARTGVQTIDGTEYTFDEDGFLVTDTTDHGGVGG